MRKMLRSPIQTWRNELILLHFFIIKKYHYFSYIIDLDKKFIKNVHLNYIFSFLEVYLYVFHHLNEKYLCNLLIINM